MISEFNKRKLRFLVLPTSSEIKEKSLDLDRAYDCWKNIWHQAFTEEMNVKDELYSDNFSRQSLVAVLFLGQDPVGLTTLKVMDLNNKIDMDDSYFKVWPLKTLNDLKQKAQTIMTCCNVTLNFKYRRNALGISGKDLLLAMLVRYLKSTSIDAIVSAVRLEKGMEKAAYRVGAHSLTKNLPYSIPGQYVDIVCWERTVSDSSWDPEIRELSQYIWTSSTEIYQIKEEKEAKGELYAA